MAIVADDSGPAHGVPWTLTRLREQAFPGYVIDVVHSDRSVDIWTVRRPDLVHLGASGPAVDAARAAARALGIRTVVSHHLAPGPEALGDPRLFLSPGPAADALLLERRVVPERIARWEPGACGESLHPARYAPDALPGASRCSTPDPSSPSIASSSSPTRSKSPASATPACSSPWSARFPRSRGASAAASALR